MIFFKNPKIDYILAFFGGKPIPTKQDKYAPIKVFQILENGQKEVLNDFYVKNPVKESISEFNSLIRDKALEIFTENNKIRKPHEVEVLISISITEKRYKEVDIDNLAKCVLDSLNNIAFEDDSQISSLICNKHIHPMKVNGIMIGITKLTDTNKGLQNDFKMIKDTEW